MNSVASKSMIILLFSVLSTALAQSGLNNLQDWISQAENWNEEYAKFSSDLNRRYLYEFTLERSGSSSIEAKSDFELRRTASPLWDNFEALLSHPGNPLLNQFLEEAYPENWSAAYYYYGAVSDASEWVGWILETDFNLEEYEEIRQITDKYDLYLAIADLYQRIAQEVSP